MNKIFCSIMSCIMVCTTTEIRASDEPNLPSYVFDSFDKLYKKITPEYLYKLYDNHKEMHSFVDHLFKIHSVVHKHEIKDKKLVVYSLFWKKSTPGLGKVAINENTIKDPTLCRKKMSFFDNYVRPMIKQIKDYESSEPDTVVRIYLANDLQFMIPELMYSNVEIYLMESDSIGHSPGAMWRFMALNEMDATCVCIKDADGHSKGRHEEKINQWIKDKKTKGWYRFTKYSGIEDLKQAVYSPIIANNFGAKKMDYINIEKAMKGYIIHRTLNPFEKRHPRDIASSLHPQGFGNHFPVYGFDERFLKHVVYYQAAERGELYTLTVHEDREDDFRKLLKSDKRYILQKDYDFIYRFNKNPIYY